MPKSECLNGSPACSHACKHKETGAASEVSTPENIIARTLANAPPNEDLLRGRVRPCRSCGAPTVSSDGICRDCADAMRAERSEALSALCRVHRVRRVEDLPVSVLQEMQVEWGRC